MAVRLTRLHRRWLGQSELHQKGWLEMEEFKLVSYSKDVISIDIADDMMDIPLLLSFDGALGTMND